MSIDEMLKERDYWMVYCDDPATYEAFRTREEAEAFAAGRTDVSLPIDKLISPEEYERQKGDG